MRRCAIVILAAGASTRMGFAKQSLEYQGSTLLRRAVETAIVCVCRPIVVVLGARADELRGLVDGLPVTLVVNPDWERGIGTSIRAGVHALGWSQVDAAMILLCDQPLISAATLDRVIEAWSSSGKAMAAAFYAGTLGTPAIFSASVFDELLSLPDSQGGKAVLGRHPDDVCAFPMPEAEVDLDTADDLKRLQELKPQMDTDEHR